MGNGCLSAALLAGLPRSSGGGLGELGLGDVSRAHRGRKRRMRYDRAA